jgi:hypothetical protein
MVAEYRDTGRRFRPGSRGGPGRPRGCTKSEHLRRSLIESVTPEHVKAVALKPYELALDGDVAAARCYLEQTVGRPLQAVELSAPADPGITAMRLLNTIMDALSPLTNYAEIRDLIVKGLRRLEVGPGDGPSRLESSDDLLN